MCKIETHLVKNPAPLLERVVKKKSYMISNNKSVPVSKKNVDIIY